LRASGAGHREEAGSRTLESGAEVAGGRARTATLTAFVLVLTIIRTVGSDMREARAAAASLF
jgi:hypothetical protein